MNNIYECEGVSKKFTLEKIPVEALSEITFSTGKNSSLGIIGPSGCGKSTLLNLLAGLDEPTKGIIKYKGSDISQMSNEELSSWRNNDLGFVYQFHHLLPEFTALENVSLPLQISGETKKDSLKISENFLSKVGLDNRMNHLPSELSGGERQRAAIARAISNNPSCLIMDEPTGDLDSKNASLIIDLILELIETRKINLIVATHDMVFAEQMDNVINLSNG